MSSKRSSSTSTDNCAASGCRFAASKRQEKRKFEAIITTLEYETYLRNI